MGKKVIAFLLPTNSIFFGPRTTAQNFIKSK